LDIESREAIEEGLADFSGTIIVVSHDRWFLEKVAERVVLVEGRAFSPYEGSFEEYWRDRGSPRRLRPGRAAAEGLEGRSAATKSAARKRGDDARESRRASLEARLSSMEKRKEELESASAAATAARDFARAGKNAREAAELGRALERLYAEWEALE